MRGLRLTPVGAGDAAGHLRPTSDRVRESLFNILMSLGNPCQDAIVLDLFAGTGALGLEALSRGAVAVTFVEKGRVAQRLLNANIALARAESMCRTVPFDATRLPQNTSHPATLVFLDPPYGKSLGSRALDSALAGGWLAQDALIVWEDSSPQQHPRLTPIDVRRYGDTHLSILRAP